jgi:hypothetical protein
VCVVVMVRVVRVVVLHGSAWLARDFSTHLERDFVT